MGPHTVYCIFRLSKYWENIAQDLEKHNIKGLKPIIPTVEIPKKTKGKLDNKGVSEKEVVPLLFNYGFMEMPSNKAYDRVFLRKLQKIIPGINGWLYNTETLFPRRGPRARVDNIDTWDDYSVVAMVTKEQIDHYNSISENNSFYSSRDVINLNIGDIIQLKHYPFSGLEGCIEDINLSLKEVIVSIQTISSRIKTTLPLECVVDTVYNNYEVPEDYVPIKKPTTDNL